MVDDHSFDTQPAGQFDHLTCVDPIIDSDYEVRSPSRERVHSGRGEAITFVAMRKINQGRGSQTRENTSEDVRAEDAIAIVVAMDGYPLLLPHCFQNAIDCLLHKWDGHGIGKIVPGWIFQKCVDVSDATSGEDFEQQWVEKHCFSSR